MSSQARSIKRLDETVVNRIAAGEVIQRPSNMCKELIENSLDADAKMITITVKDGGMALFTIQDDGCGIPVESYDILCERFTTSKLTTFEDLRTIGTFGFRGEALASITHVARVTIQSKTAEQQCAYVAQYGDSKLVGGRPRACAGTTGTSITVEDLFYNMPTRKRAVRNANDELRRIEEVVLKYAMHNADRGVGFSVKKSGAQRARVHAPPGQSLRTCVQSICGAAIANDLVEASVKEPKFSARLLASNANVNASDSSGVRRLGKPYVFFINHRLVEFGSLKRAFDTVLNSYLPKGWKAFVYCEIECEPTTVDVNVHPTKSEVHILGEEVLIERLQRALDDALRAVGSSRTFLTQQHLAAETSALLVGGSQGSQRKKKRGPSDDGFVVGRGALDDAQSGMSLAARGIAQQKMIRTDHRTQTLQALFARTGTVASESSQPVKVTAALPDKGDDGGDDEGAVDLSPPPPPSAAPPVLVRRTSGIVPDVAPLTQKLQAELRDMQQRDAADMAELSRPLVAAVTPAETLCKDNERAYKALAVPSLDEIEKQVSSTSDSSLPEAFRQRLEQRAAAASVPSPHAQPARAPAREPSTSSYIDRDGKVVTVDAAEAEAPPPPPSSSASAGVALTTTPAARREYCLSRLTSVRNLVNEREVGKSEYLYETLREHVYVGLVRPSLLCVQIRTKLFLVDLSALSRELFYQLVLQRFAQFGRLRLSQPLSVYAMIDAALEDTGGAEEFEVLARGRFKPAKAALATDPATARGERADWAERTVLRPMREMLAEYFSIEINDEGELCALPQIIARYVPPMVELPRFLMRLALAVDWTNEQRCFRGVAEELARFYAVREQPWNEELQRRGSDQWAAHEWTVRYVLLPEVRAVDFYSPNRFVTDGVFQVIAQLEKLYSVFERC